MVRFIALASESAGWDVQHASAGGDRLIVLTELGVSDEDGASVPVGYDRTMVTVLKVPRNTFLQPMPGI